MFDKRAIHIAEYLDDPACDPDLAAKSYRFMALVNKYLGGRSVVRRFLAEQYRRRGGPLHVLDLGSGPADIPAAMLDWASRRGWDIRFTCVENNPVALELARRRMRTGGLEVLAADARELPAESRFDCATASMFFHHFADDAMLDLIARLRPHVRHALLINDLAREPHAWLAVRVAPLLDPALRHDALVSIRRGFRRAELERLLAVVPHADVAVREAAFARLAAIVTFKGI